MLEEFPEKPSIVRKDFFIVFILIFNAFTWHFITYIMIDDVLGVLNATNAQIFIIWATHYVAVIGSIIVGSILPKKNSRVNLLYLWIILGAVTSSLPALFSNLTMTHASIISLLWGISFGLGIPSCLAYFADCTLVGNRGRISGIIWLITNLIAPPLVILFGMLNLIINSIIFAVWRASALIVFFLKPEEKIASEKKRDISFVSVLNDKSFVLYFIAWFMFMSIDHIEKPILDFIFRDFYYLMMAPIIGSLAAFIAGLLCDRIGRKRVVLYGFVTMGIAYAIIGIAPEALFSWYLFVTVESTSIGIFYVTFILVLWGDLSQSGTREKYYAIGETPFWISDVGRLLLAPLVTLIPTTSAFSLASFFLFLAVLPLLYAPETLPERKIELRRLRKYIEKAKKIQEKYEEKAA